MAYYFISHPLTSLKNLLNWGKIKCYSHRFPTTPIVFLNIDVDNLIFEREVMNKMSAVFLDIKCGDKLTKKQIRRYQARQQLIYLKEKRSLKHDLLISKQLIDNGNLCTLLMDSFAKFNLKWQY